MAEIVLPTKPLSVNPLKASQPIGASLAFLGLADAMPLEHGARGCTSFNKLFFMRHFREPIALQTTAMDQMTTVLGADSNVVEALATICEKDKPRVIGLITTGLSETHGADVPRTIEAFREEFPQHDGVAIIPASASDTLGCLETGFAAALEAIIGALVPASPSKLRRPRQVNVLASAMLAPGDVEAIKDWIAAFGLSRHRASRHRGLARRPHDRRGLFDAVLWRNAARRHRPDGRIRRHARHRPLAGQGRRSARSENRRAGLSLRRASWASTTATPSPGP